MRKIKLTENQFNKLVSKCVKRALTEMSFKKRQEMNADWEELEKYKENPYKRKYGAVPDENVSMWDNSGGNGAYTTMSALGCYGKDCENYAKSIHGTSLRDL